MSVFELLLLMLLGVQVLLAAGQVIMLWHFTRKTSTALKAIHGTLWASDRLTDCVAQAVGSIDQAAQAAWAAAAACHTIARDVRQQPSDRDRAY